MQENRCPQCGAPINPGDTECRYCGEKLAQNQNGSCQQPQPQVVYIKEEVPESEYPSSWPIKNKIVAGLLAIFLGGIGIHKFYLGKTGTGIIYLLFCWTGIPEIVGFIEGIVYLCSNDHNFQIRHQVRFQ